MLAVRLTSPRRRQDRPIESVELKVTFRADRETSRIVREAFPEARFVRGVCEVKMKGEEPKEIAEKAKELLERLRSADRKA